MTDIRIHRPVSKVPIAPPPYAESQGEIIVSGIDLTVVTHLEVDGNLTSAFELLSPSKLSVSGNSQSEVIAYTANVTRANESSVVVGTSSRAEMLSDPREVLRQRVIKALLSDEGSDAFSGLGSGLDSLAGSSVGSRAVTEAVSRVRDVELALLSVERADEPLGSALSHINILGARQDSAYDARLLIQIVNKEGESVETEVISE